MQRPSLHSRESDIEGVMNCANTYGTIDRWSLVFERGAMLLQALGIAPRPAVDFYLLKRHKKACRWWQRRKHLSH